jgi:predicted porin
MKKHLIAAAVAGVLAAPAMAQVTVYGVMELGVVNNDAATSTTKMGSGYINTSRLGFKGEEDLGGGMKAIFGMEMRLDPTNGANSEDWAASGGRTEDAFFERGAFVGLSGGFGTVKLGRQDHQGGENNDATFFDSMGNQGLNNPSTEIGSDTNDTITYDTPSFGGFSLNIGHSLADNGADPVGANEKHDGITSFQLKGSMAGVGVKLGYAKQDLAGGGDNKSQGIGVSYDAGAFKAGLAYQKRENDSGTEPTYTVLNAVIPMGGGLNLGVQYGTYDADTTAAADYDRTGVFLTKALSKRTAVTGYYQSNDYGTGGTDSDNLAFFVTHKF